jgi:light-regulated signal transduction histidine kinase (bacteriophytochrome)
MPIRNLCLFCVYGIRNPPKNRKTGKVDKKRGACTLDELRTLAEAHGGKVELKSDIESGTTFSVLLPFDRKPVGKII